MTRLHIRPLADADADAAADYYANEANLGLALRFLNAVDLAYERLCQHPHIGSQVKVVRPPLAGLRFWPVPSFERYLVFYLPLPELVDVVRVLHSARDLSYLLDIDEA